MIDCEDLLEEIEAEREKKRAPDPWFVWLYVIAAAFLLSVVFGCETAIVGGKLERVPEGAVACGFGAGPPGAGALTFIVLPKDATGNIKFGPDCHPQVDLKIGG